MNCCTGAGRFLNIFANCWIIGINTSKIGAIAADIAPPNSAIANFIAFIACCCLSIGSSVASKVFATVPLAFSAVSDNPSRLNAPRLIASIILAAPLLPNTAAASVNAAVLLSAFLIFSIVPLNPGDRVLPSLAYLAVAFVIAVSVALESTPAFSSCPINVAPSENDNPNSLI